MDICLICTGCVLCATELSVGQHLYGIPMGCSHTFIVQRTKTSAQWLENSLECQAKSSTGYSYIVVPMFLLKFCKLIRSFTLLLLLGLFLFRLAKFCINWNIEHCETSWNYQWLYIHPSLHACVHTYIDVYICMHVCTRWCKRFIDSSFKLAPCTDLGLNMLCVYYIMERVLIQRELSSCTFHLLAQSSLCSCFMQRDIM